MHLIGRRSKAENVRQLGAAGCKCCVLTLPNGSVYRSAVLCSSGSDIHHPNCFSNQSKRNICDFSSFYSIETSFLLLFTVFLNGLGECHYTVRNEALYQADAMAPIDKRPYHPTSSAKRISNNELRQIEREFRLVTHKSQRSHLVL